MEDILAIGRETLDIEAQALTGLKAHLGEAFAAAAKLVKECTGRVIVTGMGKSGIIGQKIAATLASTGTPAYFLHAAEAIHGDLGMVVEKDVVIALSYSGQTEETTRILPIIRRMGAHLISITGNLESELARRSDVALYAGVVKEACPLNLAPTASTTAALAMGDALAMAVLQMRGFKAEDFAVFHPGGKLGKLLVKVREVMVTGERLPLNGPDDPMREVIGVISRKGHGLTCIVDGKGKVLGIVTDGDLRRAMERDDTMLAKPAHLFMSANPKTIDGNALAARAVKVMEDARITGLVVKDVEGRLEGVVKLQDLLEAGVV